MKETAIYNCYTSPDPSNEQFIPDHTFMHLVAGAMTIYDGSKEYHVKPGDYGIGRRNHLSRYTKQTDNGDFRKIYIVSNRIF